MIKKSPRLSASPLKSDICAKILCFCGFKNTHRKYVENNAIIIKYLLVVCLFKYNKMKYSLIHTMTIRNTEIYKFDYKRNPEEILFVGITIKKHWKR
jgi:hypothetical protein